MYEEARKPRMLIDLPVQLIRPLPVLYYANKFIKRNRSQKIQNLYESNLLFLEEALKLLSDMVNNDAFNEVSSEIKQMNKIPSTGNLEKLQIITQQIARLCSQEKNNLREKSLLIKSEFVKLYRHRVNTLKILVIRMNDTLTDIKKILGILREFCQYDTDSVEAEADHIHSKISESDYVIFSSVASPDIHRQVQKLQTYRRPGLALAPINPKGPFPRQTIRHGSQLAKIGFPVIFRIFTPLRLFTTIEKTYLYYYLA